LTVVAALLMETEGDDMSSCKFSTGAIGLDFASGLTCFFAPRISSSSSAPKMEASLDELAGFETDFPACSIKPNASALSTFYAPRR
jgi:hypothetical protein